VKASDFRLYDVLNCAATAVDEAESGRPAVAGAAWTAATDAASGLFPVNSPASNAISVILAASRPGRQPEGRAALWTALDAAALAILTAMGGQEDALAEVLPDAHAATRRVTPSCEVALSRILRLLPPMAAKARSEATT
jgi:hypothetical protein